MAVYEYRDYKVYLRSWIESQPKKGRGTIRRMAEHLRMSPTMMSHILTGEKHLSVEAASDLANFIGLNEDEFEYFLLLLLFGRAGSFSLQERLRLKIEQEQKQAQEIAKRVKVDSELPEIVKTIFYSSWIYTGVRNMTACPDFKNVDSIARHLSLSPITVQKVVDFLLHNGLCVMKNEKLEVGPQQTHVGTNSVLVSKHHQNWRLQAFNKMLETNDRNLFFTAPMSMSADTAEQIRSRLPGFIEDIVKLVRPSPSEIVRCLNIDWFDY